MCGIVGYVNQNGFEPDHIAVMTATLAHRGPDGGGTHVDTAKGVALGHRRLKVIDLSEAAAQPMRLPHQDVWISYNGEIYNYRSLADQLERQGHRLTTTSDTEVVLVAYVAYGPDFVERLEGDFAMAVWDGRTATLHLYRDRLGVRPLYYVQVGGTFAFASEIKALFKHPALPKRVNTERLGEYLGHLFIGGGETLFSGVHELMPGEHLTLKNGRMTLARWHSFEPKPEVANASEDQQIEGFIERLDQSIKQRLIADIPVGIYLSGGIDSGLLALRAAGCSLDSLTLGFPGGLDEFETSSTAAAIAGFRHHTFIAAPDDVVDQVIHHFDEPNPHPVSIPQYLLARHSKPIISVALSGSGGDELFAGYSHYRAAQGVFDGLGPASEDPDQAEYQSTLPPDMIAGEFKSCTQFHLVRRMMPSAEDYRLRYASLYRESPFADFLTRMLHLDIQTHLVSVLNKDDKMNMAFGIEGRFPYLDHRVVEYALSMSPTLKLGPSGVGKYALKSYLARQAPELAPFRAKRAFPTPAAAWLTAELQSSGLGDLRRNLGDVLDFSFVEQMVQDYLGGRTAHMRRLWGLCGLQRWLNANF